MKIKGRLGTHLAKLFRIKGYKMEFSFRRVRHDPELTKLAFLNQSLTAFDEGVRLFREEVQDAIRKENTTQKTDKWAA